MTGRSTASRARRSLSAALVLALAGLVGCVAGPVPLGPVIGRDNGSSKKVTLISNQDNTVFLGRAIGGGSGAFIRGEQAPDAQPDAEGRVALGQGRFVAIALHPKGVYEIVARPPGYRERSSTIAPPLTSRLSFTFEISDRVGATRLAEEPAGEVRIDVTRPVVQLESLNGSAVSGDQTAVVISARTGAGVSKVVISVNGDPVPLPRGLERTRGSEFSTTQKIPLVPGQNLVHVAVTDTQGRVGHQTLRIDRSQRNDPVRAATAPSGSARRSFEPDYGRRVAAVIGINRYQQWPALEGATGDARRMASKLREMGFDEVLELYDGEATRAGILRVLGEELPRRTERNDLAFIFFAGHGQTETLANGEKRGYIIPVEGSMSGVFSSAISMETLRDLSRRIPAKHVYYAMDSCYSGLGFTRGVRAVGDDPGNEYFAKITSLPAVQMVTAGMEGEEAIERGGRGLFTDYLLRALEGEADMNADGIVTAGEIGAFVRPGVTRASRQRQTPLYGTIDGNGEIAFQLPSPGSN